LREFPVFRHITKLQKLALPLTLTYRLRRWFSGGIKKGPPKEAPFLLFAIYTELLYKSVLLVLPHTFIID